MNKLINIIALVILTSCVSQSDYDELKAEKDELELKYIELQAKVEQYEKAEAVKNEIPYISEERALEIIEDYFSFYAAGVAYRRVKLRRVAKNIFKVSLETGDKKALEASGYSAFFWQATVKTLTVRADGTYDF